MSESDAAPRSGIWSSMTRPKLVISNVPSRNSSGYMSPPRRTDFSRASVVA
jgi:hypothetical protein